MISKRREGYDVLKVEYPDYASESSALVRMYLGGAFGDRAQDVIACTDSQSIAETFGGLFTVGDV